MLVKSWKNLDDLKFSLLPDDPDINEADQLLRKYNIKLIKLYGSATIKPNHYYATHIAEYI
ncbi:hypothetical protein EDD22DRAFT_956380 [Suillus occidentalis]|nr:hypothetical protein EDD22DRAFT_956380 [Suillus occidentalis]